MIYFFLIEKVGLYKIKYFFNKNANLQYFHNYLLFSFLKIKIIYVFAQKIVK
ncbi:MAG: hypothetical protein TRG1_2745 [Flavobacteriaceae bacterium FS1-H7996/R]|nr:MAG: hypothetical protein TRG1_2745 [Flavobacteriaceae bacterium FS1-H7996/R]